MSGRRPASWSISTSKRSARSRPAGAGGCMAAGRRRPSGDGDAAATPICTSRSTTTPASPMSRRSMMRRPTRCWGSGAEPRTGSGPTTWLSTRSSPTAAELHLDQVRRAARPAPHQTPPHPALPAPNERQSRAIQPHPGRRVPLRPQVQIRDRPQGPPGPLGSRLQLPSTPHRGRRPTRITRIQPHAHRQLALLSSA